MLGEHILYSIAVAIIVGAFYKHNYGYELPIWIIAACAWLPDVDYISQCIFFLFPTVISGDWYIIGHGDFHNIPAMIGFSYVIAYFFNKFKKYAFKDVFLCVMIGFGTHLLCDYLVYPYIYNPLSRVISQTQLYGINLIPEHGSFYGICEIPIVILGLIFILFALIVKLYYTNIALIDDSNHNVEEI